MSVQLVTTPQGAYVPAQQKSVSNAGNATSTIDTATIDTVSAAAFASVTAANVQAGAIQASVTNKNVNVTGGLQADGDVSITAGGVNATVSLGRIVAKSLKVVVTDIVPPASLVSATEPVVATSSEAKVNQIRPGYSGKLVVTEGLATFKLTVKDDNIKLTSRDPATLTYKGQDYVVREEGLYAIYVTPKGTLDIVKI